jgi:hypothetical protein
MPNTASYGFLNRVSEVRVLPVALLFSVALADAEIPRAWAGTEIPGLPTHSEPVRLIADRVIPRVTG